MDSNNKIIAQHLLMIRKSNACDWQHSALTYPLNSHRSSNGVFGFSLTDSKFWLNGC